jgi:hypothetical protein
MVIDSDEFKAAADPRLRVTMLGIALHLGRPQLAAIDTLVQRQSQGLPS